MTWEKRWLLLYLCTKTFECPQNVSIQFHGKSTRFGLFIDQQTKGNSEKYKFLCFSRYAFSFTTISFVAHELVRCRIQFLYSNEIILHNIKANEAEKKHEKERKRLAIYYIKLEFKWLH